MSWLQEIPIHPLHTHTHSLSQEGNLGLMVFGCMLAIVQTEAQYSVPNDVVYKEHASNFSLRRSLETPIELVNHTLLWRQEVEPRFPTADPRVLPSQTFSWPRDTRRCQRRHSHLFPVYLNAHTRVRQSGCENELPAERSWTAGLATVYWLVS